MHEREIDLDTRDGRMPVLVTRPEEGRHPTVILFMEALGIREELRDMARRIGTVGYYVMLANLFYREGGASFDPALLPTQGPDPEMMRINLATTHAMVLADTEAMLRFAADDPAARDPVGTIGYCMGGPIVMRTAAAVPNRVGAVGSFHGGGLTTMNPDSPHLLIPQTNAQYLIAVAENDDMRDSTSKDILKKAFADANKKAEVEVYKAAHGWCPPDSGVYDRGEAERAWGRMLAMFKTALA